MGKVKIKIDEGLFEEARKFSEKAGYSSVEEFIAHIVEKELSASGDSDDEKEVREKLKGLGYIS